MNLPFDPSFITDDVILSRGAAHQLMLTEPEQLQFLRDVSSHDLQAAPGCGKTTLIGLKLCLMASGWKSDVAGVCVLSHTNVAKDQIIELLRKDAHGRRFLAYPHFIGTIQGFVDTYLAKPALLSQGNDVRAIDDMFYALATRRELRNNTYKELRTLCSAGSRRTDIAPIVQTAHYVWEDDSLKIYGIHNNKRTPFPFGPGARSTQQYVALKNSVSNNGIYMYADMYAIARQHLHANPQLNAALRMRFPFMLIDEMQDTSLDQEAFVNGIFNGRDCVVQRVGDVNQRIYSDHGGGEPDPAQFPKIDHSVLPRSMRFGSPIASAASPLTMSSPQVIVGNDRREANMPRLLLFEQDSIDKVLPRFAEEVVSVVPTDEIALYPVKAVGAKRSGNANQFPKRIQCYWPDFNPEPSKAKRSNTFIESVTAVQIKQSLSWKERSDVLLDACCELLIHWNITINGLRPTPSRLRAKLTEMDHSHFLNVRTSILKLNNVDLQDEGIWDDAMVGLCDSLKLALDLPDRPALAVKYCEYGEMPPPTNAAIAKCEKANIVVNGETVSIDIATIHAVKGETHSATILLECFHEVYDLKEVLPIMVNRHDVNRVRNTKSIVPAARRIFVGMTRPRNLVAFAVLKSHIEDYLDDFSDAGWVIIDLTVMNQ